MASLASYAAERGVNDVFSRLGSSHGWHLNLRSVKEVGLSNARAQRDHMNPVGRFSSQSASEKESTNAFVAA